MSWAIEKVFSTPELAESVLEYACSGESYQETKDLRLVCKSWGSLAVKPLYSSFGLPSYHLEVNRKSDTDTQFITDFRAACGAALPFDLQISGHLNTAVYQFLQEFAPRIVKLELKVNSNYVLEEPADDINFQLVNLKKLSVDLELSKDYSCLNLEAFRHKILEHTKNLRFFKMEYKHQPIPGMPLPPQLTHLDLISEPSELDRLVADHDLPCLTSLGVTLLETDEDVPYEEYDEDDEYDADDDYDVDDEDGEDDEDDEKVNLVLDRLICNLEELKICRNGFYEIYALVLPVAEKLKTLSVSVRLATSDGGLLCNALPNLTNATFEVDAWVFNDLNVFLAPGSVYQNLKSLTILHSNDLAINGFMPGGFRMNIVPECPSLEYLKFSGFTAPVFLATLPTMFSEWTSIKHLLVEMEDVYMDGSCSSDDLMTVLTGLRENQVPRNEKLWTTMLHDRTNSIRNLNALEKLELKVPGWSCSLEKFVFKAAFFQMEKLKSIELFGAIPVDEEMVAAWKASGREILESSFHKSNEETDEFNFNDLMSL